ncbi:hypothetical protein GQ53DRAFT_69677 [Thozetella sp. PMI_491]|nr:hypothetical protein GQ53DRAFT_69677 [Thozetella sp. PMI_491]
MGGVCRNHIRATGRQSVDLGATPHIRKSAKSRAGRVSFRPPPGPPRLKISVVLTRLAGAPPPRNPGNREQGTGAAFLVEAHAKPNTRRYFVGLAPRPRLCFVFLLSPRPAFPPPLLLRRTVRTRAFSSPTMAVTSWRHLSRCVKLECFHAQSPAPLMLLGPSSLPLGCLLGANLLVPARTVTSVPSLR